MTGVVLLDIHSRKNFHGLDFNLSDVLCLYRLPSHYNKLPPMTAVGVLKCIQMTLFERWAFESALLTL